MNLLLALAYMSSTNHLETLGTSASVTLITPGKSSRIDVTDGNVVTILGPDHSSVGLIEPQAGTCKVINTNTGAIQATVLLDKRTAQKSTYCFDPMGNLIQFDPTTRRLVIHRTQIHKHSFWVAEPYSAAFRIDSRHAIH